MSTSHENLLRRTAERRGFRLEKCRRRDPKSVGFGLWRLTEPDGDLRQPFTLTLADVELKLDVQPANHSDDLFLDW